MDHLHWVTSKAARVAGFPEALLAGWDKAGRDGIPDNLPLKDKLLGRVLWQRLHIAHHTAILSLTPCMHPGISLKMVIRKSSVPWPCCLAADWGQLLLEAIPAIGLAVGVFPAEELKY
jgi:hypothetical protein